MKTQLLSKQFWLRFSGYFFWYLVLYTFITYLFREKNEPFWSISNISDKIGFALFMALVFALWNKSTVKHQVDPIVSKPTLKEFVGTYLITIAFVLPLLVVLIAIVWVAIELFSHNNEPFWPVLLKTLLVTAVLCLLINVYFSISQLISYRRQQKNL